LTDPTDLSAELRTALERFRRFAVSDDAVRGAAIESAATPELEALADTIDPLFAEINAVLDRFDATSHPLPDADAELEHDLHAVAQAGEEARIEVDRRRGGGPLDGEALATKGGCLTLAAVIVGVLAVACWTSGGALKTGPHLSRMAENSAIRRRNGAARRRPETSGVNWPRCRPLGG
jgi:hypothetical protein